MPTIEIPVATLSIQSANPNKRFGNPPAIPMRASNTAQRMLARAALTPVPANAVVSSAVLRVWQGAAGTGSVTLKAQANLNKGWTTSTTWSTAPALDVTEYSATRSAPAANTPWDLDVSTLVQSWVSGDATNYGWTLLTTSNTSGSLRGGAAPSRRPVLIVTYAVTPVTPTGLHPTGGADAIVSLTKPTLTFNVTADTTAIQVQVDPAANATSPAFDSGERASTAGLLNLATTTYAGLADGALTYWRARAKGSLGWSDWSGWASFTRRTWRALTLDSPGTTTEDPSPPITASYVGTVTQWRTLLKSTTGSTVEDSGWTAGSTVEFATTKNVTGGAGVAEAQIRDDLPRVTTPGDPDYLVVRRPFTVTNGPVTPVAGVTVAQQPGRPWVAVTASRAQVPDEVLVYRDDVLVARIPGIDAFNRETMTVVDQTVSMNTPAVYSVQVMAGGRSSTKVAATAITPHCPGIWLADETTGEDVVLWGDAEQGQEEPELAVVHEPIGGDIVRRRLARSPRRGTLEGTLADVGPRTAIDCERTLNAWAQQDAGHTYRLLLGNRNDRVILGDIVVTETAQSAQERFSEATLSWWAA